MRCLSLRLGTSNYLEVRRPSKDLNASHRFVSQHLVSLRCQVPSLDLQCLTPHATQKTLLTVRRTRSIQSPSGPSNSSSPNQPSSSTHREPPATPQLSYPDYLNENASPGWDAALVMSSLIRDIWMHTPHSPGHKVS
ncbi:hypothetical protein BS47DRAFT_308972 [Hydnum rufescens UP504]|uniref:Uncharacterized protein n=1 Tax=Hydnum rufescens UP504 TaxID=1448309 RepID=A0A9P6AKU2_9AGAM|nr:hypothetical protein BS47DRAFT_308972 [Hydnum rufescens UP504]